MKYNKSYEGVDFEEYLKYLREIKNDISAELYNFVSNPERHNFSEESLHDSFIEKIEIKNKAADIVIELVGNNRTFVLYFTKASQYKIMQNTQEGYRDLITYEIGIEKDDENNKRMVFRALFGFDYGEIEIYCKEIKIEEKYARY